jgi:hypothetical protein
MSGHSGKSSERLTVPFQDRGDKAQVVLKGRRSDDITVQQQSQGALAQDTELL